MRYLFVLFMLLIWINSELIANEKKLGCPSQKLNTRGLIGNASMLQNVTLFNDRFRYLEGTGSFDA